VGGGYLDGAGGHLLAEMRAERLQPDHLHKRFRIARFRLPSRVTRLWGCAAGAGHMQQICDYCCAAVQRHPQALLYRQRCHFSSRANNRAAAQHFTLVRF
jgi:hypothetical protein